jgi:hypothetical protein
VSYKVEDQVRKADEIFSALSLIEDCEVLESADIIVEALR